MDRGTLNALAPSLALSNLLGGCFQVVNVTGLSSCRAKARKTLAQGPKASPSLRQMLKYTRTAVHKPWIKDFGYHCRFYMTIATHPITEKSIAV